TERSRASSTPAIARPPLPPRGFSTTSSQEPLQSGIPQSPPLPPLSALVQGPPKFPPPVPPRPPPVPPRPSVPSRTHPKEEPAQQENVESQGNPLWQKVMFWENAFVDVVAQERDIVGMDQEPSEMIERYAALSDSEKKRLELEEDRLLSTLLHNMTAYMIMCGTGQKAIQQKIRRLLGKAHIGLVCSKEINKLLDKLPQTQGNSIPLKPLGSRLVQKHSFAVHGGSSSQDDIMFMEVLCLWRRHEDKVYMHKFYTKKCRELYQCMKKAMERAAARGRVSIESRALGGEFPVHDTETNQGGLLQVRCDGVSLIFANSQHFIDLANIKKCNTFGGNVFLLEEFDRKKNELVQRRYYSQMVYLLFHAFCGKVMWSVCMLM
ncbi:hypothetical protein OSTOST_05268, partial [Ostertagia ostertagi]